MSRAASGTQVHLRFGELTAQVGQVAAVLRGFWSGPVALTETWPDDKVPPMGAGIVLSPFPNRVAGGRWPLAGRSQQLDITEPSLGNAIHGLLRNTAYQVEDRQAHAVTLAAPIYPQHGYPFTLDTSVRYALGEDGLTVTHHVENVGTASAPFGVGAHPYLRVGTGPVEDLRLTLVADTVVVVYETMIPVRREPVGPPTDLSAGPSVGPLTLASCFTDLRRADDRVQAQVLAADGHGVTLWADENFDYLQVFNPTNFPDFTGGLAAGRRALAVEPMTCAVDAFNSGAGLRWLAPGESWSGSWGLRPTGF